MPATLRFEAMPEEAEAALSVLGGFGLVVEGAAVSVPGAAQRVVALLALQSKPVRRSYVAQVLWPDKSEARAQANMRGALWRLGQVAPNLVNSSSQTMEIDADVTVDFRDFWSWSGRLISGRARLDDLATAVVRRGWELLPEWYEDWIELERERTRQRWLHALESLAAELIRVRRFAQAVDVSLTAVAVDPLRESAHRAVMLAHLGEDNFGEARRQYERCRRTLKSELGITPSAELAALVASESSLAGDRR